MRLEKAFFKLTIAVSSKVLAKEILDSLLLAYLLVLEVLLVLSTNPRFFIISLPAY